MDRPLTAHCLLSARLPTTGACHPPRITRINTLHGRAAAVSFLLSPPLLPLSLPCPWNHLLAVSQSVLLSDFGVIYILTSLRVLPNTKTSNAPPLPRMVRAVAPLPFHYAVLRMDPEAMVKDLGLDDAATLDEVRQMSVKKYLVYLDWVRSRRPTLIVITDVTLTQPDELPMAQVRWCRYRVSPIGPTLRPPDAAHGITSDMVVPIAPNKSHIDDRRPVHPKSPFPYSNCYHWIQTSTSVRVRVHEEGVEHDGAIRLSPAEHSAIKDRFSADFTHIASSRPRDFNPSAGPLQPAEASSAIDVAASAEVNTAAPTLTNTYLRLVTQRRLRTSALPSESDDESQRSPCGSSGDLFDCAQTGKSTMTPATSVSAAAMDVFGWDPDSATALIPLVDVWLDIDQHLKEHEIPSPLDLQQEIVQVRK